MRAIISKIAMTICVLTASSVSANCCTNECGQFNFYVGGNIGIASRTGHLNDYDGFLTDNSGWSFIDSGFIGGGQAGIDWYRNNTVFGIVGDWNCLNVSGKYRDNPNAVGFDNFFKHDLDWMATVRGRAGVTVCDAMLYITAGGANIRYNTRWHDDPDTFKHNTNQWGWVGGVGAEFKTWCNFSIGAELLYAQFNEQSKTFVALSADQYKLGRSNSLWVGKLMLNYNFGDFRSLCCK